MKEGGGGEMNEKGRRDGEGRDEIKTGRLGRDTVGA
jgi:hypothetical protein